MRKFTVEEQGEDHWVATDGERITEGALPGEAIDNLYHHSLDAEIEEAGYATLAESDADRECQRAIYSALRMIQFLTLACSNEDSIQLVESELGVLSRHVDGFLAAYREHLDGPSDED